MIGMGASVLNGAVVEEGALVAAGAVVSENKVVKANTLVAGVPAKPIRDLTEENVSQAKEGALHYVKKSSAYKEQNVM
ncbi:gamma carbonic anhydrase family protein [Salibacterium salarium]